MGTQRLRDHMGRRDPLEGLEYQEPTGRQDHTAPPVRTDHPDRTERRGDTEHPECLEPRDRRVAARRRRHRSRAVR